MTGNTSHHAPAGRLACGTQAEQWPNTNQYLVAGSSGTDCLLGWAIPRQAPKINHALCVPEWRSAWKLHDPSLVGW